MPTVARFRGLRVVIYPNDHRPAHVHVMGRDCEAVWNLGCPNGPIELREVYGFGPAELTRIAIELQDRLDALCASWEMMHGKP